MLTKRAILMDLMRRIALSFASVYSGRLHGDDDDDSA
jgi:hypothetical protein